MVLHDDGLYDVRLDVVLWGMEVEIKQWSKLCRLPANKNLSHTKISELVLSGEDWPSKFKKRDRPVNKTIRV